MVVLTAILVFAAPYAMAQQAPGPSAPAAPRLAFTNLPFEDGGIIPDQYTNRIPAMPGGSFPLSWTNVP
ncbi:MAG: hypothetical protein EOP50_19005, partial [Sphingobacteriales bacterium]